MKIFIKNIFIFFALFFVIEKSAYFLLKFSTQYQYDRRLEYILDGMINKDLIVLGSSRGGGDVLAEQLSKETGYDSYNLSYPGSDIIFHEFILNYLIKFNDVPKKIIYVVDNPTVFSEDESLSFRYDRLYPVAYNNKINDVLINNNIHGLFSKYLYATRLRRINFIFESKKKPSDRSLTSHGSTIFPYKNRDRSWVVRDTIKPIDKVFDTRLIQEHKLKAFKSIITSCKNNNIEILFAFAPNFSAMNKEFVEYFKTLIKNNNKYLIYDQNETRYKNADFFYDQAHLNPKGASIFTSEISTFINSNKEK